MTRTRTLVLAATADLLCWGALGFLILYTLGVFQ
jgi:hypothetical protein